MPEEVAIDIPEEVAVAPMFMVLELIDIPDISIVAKFSTVQGDGLQIGSRTGCEL